MDPADAPASEGVMIAFLPTSSDWCKIDLPHMTLVYAGLVGDMSATDIQNLAKDAASLASLTPPFGLRVVGKEVFGTPGDQVDVFRLLPSTELWAMRRFVEDWNKSQHPFNPHVTIGPVGSYSPMDPVPRVISFNRCFVAWGEDSLTFNLTTGPSSYPGGY